MKINVFQIVSVISFLLIASSCSNNQAKEHTVDCTSITPDYLSGDWTEQTENTTFTFSKKGVVTIKTGEAERKQGYELIDDEQYIIHFDEGPYAVKEGFDCNTMTLSNVDMEDFELILTRNEKGGVNKNQIAGEQSEDTKKTDPCKDIVCQNGGTCNNGICDCPEEFTGTNCENFNASLAQALLAKHTPKELFDGGVPLDSLYGKTYAGGLIFYLDTVDGTGMVAEPTFHRYGMWACSESIVGAKGAEIGDGRTNTDAIMANCPKNSISGSLAKVCRDHRGGNYEDWFLPSRKELKLIYTNLYSKGHGVLPYDPNLYLSSTEHADKPYSVWYLNFENGVENYEDKIYMMSDRFQLIGRPARAF